MQNTLLFESGYDTRQEEAFEAIRQERDRIGYYALPEASIDAIEAYVQTIDPAIDTIAVIGIGGSSLGAKAVYHFIRSNRALQRELLFFESTDPIRLKQLMTKITPQKTRFIVISKSGTTVETIALFKYLYARCEQDRDAFVFITDKDSSLDRFAHEIGAKCFYIPQNVGGRFSVLSAVGLVPLAAVGVDIKMLLEGARSVKKGFFQGGAIRKALLHKAYFYAKNHAKYHINCIFAYSESLRYFCEWYVQLWGESLGKHQRHSAFHVGMTPVGLIGPKDQHSFLQLIMEGTRDKTVTFINIDDFETTLRVPDLSLAHLSATDLFNDIAFDRLITLQCESVIEAVDAQGDIPVDRIVLQRVGEYEMGELLYYYELLTSLTGHLIDVNTYDQPGVELGKRILREKLNVR